MGLDSPSDGYEGLIQIGPYHVKVVDGEFHAKGQTFTVSKSGEVKVGERFIGQVKDGVLTPAQQ